MTSNFHCYKFHSFQSNLKTRGFPSPARTAFPKMTNDLDSGIFLFKSSKTRTSTDSIFQSEPPKEQNEQNEQFSKEFINGNWMKRFLLKFSNPSLLSSTKTLISPVTTEQLQRESQISYKNSKEEEVLDASKVKKITRGNRRHKIKTRKQRRIKALKK